VPTDYDQIRAENVARYGWDTAVLELLGQLYSERTHFIYELVQNAEDAGAGELTFELFGDRLELRHDGRPFSSADVRGICGVSQGTKADDLTQIGRFGIGFKSVYAYTNSPAVSSGDEHFVIESYVRPHAAEPLAGAAGQTVFSFPFDRPEVPAPAARAEIAAALSTLDAEILLFLRHIDRIEVLGQNVPSTVLQRTTKTRNAGSRAIALTATRAGRRIDAQWLVWSAALDQLGEPELRVEIGLPVRSDLDARLLVRRPSAPLVVTFPTEKETFLGFLIAGPYRTTPARDNVPEHDEWNQSLAGQTASLLTEILAELRAGRLLSVDLLQALPLDPAHFTAGSLLRPLFEAVRGSFVHAELIPDTVGGYHSAGRVRLAGDAGLRELLTPEQLGALTGTAGPVAFATPSIGADSTPVLWQYLRDEIGVAEVTPESAVAAMTAEFLAEQSDDWIGQFYRFLDQHRSLWLGGDPAGDEAGIARGRPIIRLADGRQVLPFDERGRPAAYLPGPGSAQFPTVRPAVAAQPGAGRFLVALGFAEADVLSQVLDLVLPRYADADAATLDPVRHEADLELVARALAQASAADRERLLSQLADTAFLTGENASTGQRKLLRPGDLYQRSRSLETYFDGNPQAWFAADSYGPWLPQLRAMGVREAVGLRVRPPDELGYVLLADEFAWHERGLAGFDPAAELDGLEHALTHSSFRLAELVWNTLLVPNRHLLAGVVESSARLGFVDAKQERRQSVIGTLVTELAWLPAGDGTFRRPGELNLADLPSTFERDELVAEALGMTKPVIEEANRQLGLPPGFLQRLSAHPDLIAQLETELKRREENG
jgi:hypothetical protein